MAEAKINIKKKKHESNLQLRVDGKTVSWVSVIDFPMRIGASVVRMGGIGGVGTDSQHRGNGYASKLLNNTTEWMTKQGYDCSLLFGISDFYHRFGYASCLPESVLEIAVRNAECARTSLTPRRLTSKDMPAIREIYRENNERLSGTICRDENSGWFGHGSDHDRSTQTTVFTDSEDKIMAYAVVDHLEDGSPIRDEFIVCEFGALREEMTSDILRWAADQAIALRVDTLHFHIPPESPVVSFLSQFGAEQTISYPRSGEGMGRLLRLEPFFKATLPEWTLRAAESALQAGVSARLITDLGEITLRWNGRNIKIDSTGTPSGSAWIPQHRLMQAAIGYHGWETIRLFEEVRSEGDTSLLGAIFPRRLPYLWKPDHF